MSRVPCPVSYVLCPKSFFIPGSTLEESEGVFAVTCAQAEVLNFKVEHLERKKAPLDENFWLFRCASMSYTHIEEWVGKVFEIAYNLASRGL